jgi:hypothetical protein
MFLSNTTVNVLSTQITLSALSVFVIQKLKNSSWASWFHRASDTANKVASGGLAFLTAIGIHIAWSHGALPGSYMIEVSGLTLMGVGAGLWAVLKSITFNELIYRGVVKSSADTSIKVTSSAPAVVEVNKPAVTIQEAKAIVPGAPKP